MAQSFAAKYSTAESRSTDQVQDLKSKASEVADDVSKEARTLLDQVVGYTKAKPLEAAAIAAGVAFVAGAVILGPRLMQSRQERSFDRLLRRAYREADRVRPDSASWKRLTDWINANVPNASSWR